MTKETDDDAFDIDKDTTVCCAHCTAEHDHTEYGYGEAFLLGGKHFQSGDANYVCKRHLPADMTVYQLVFPICADVAT